MRAPWSRSKPATAPIAVEAGLPAADQRHLFEREPEAPGEPLWVAIDRLDADDANPRTEVLPHELDELAADIASRGVLQPIVVAPGDAPGRYRIRFGAMRWRAARQAGLQQVPIMMSTRPRDPYDQVAEKLKRHPLSPRGRVRRANCRSTAAVRAESRWGTRLNPRKNDLHRWRETFAEKLRSWGVEAEAASAQWKRGGTSSRR